MKHPTTSPKITPDFEINTGRYTQVQRNIIVHLYHNREATADEMIPVSIFDTQRLEAALEELIKKDMVVTVERGHQTVYRITQKGLNLYRE